MVRTTLVLLCSSMLLPSAQAGELVLHVVDADTGQALHSRIHLSQGEQQIAPAESLDVLVPGAQLGRFSRSRQPYMDWYYSDGTARWTGVSGEALLRVQSGFDHIPYSQAVTVGDAGLTEVTVELQRWVNMNDLGWYGGDPHTHLMFPMDTDLMDAEIALQRCEGLNIAHGLSIYYIEQLSNERASERLGDEATYRDGDYLAVGGEEFRQPELGHVALLGVDEFILCEDPFTPLAPDAVYETWLDHGIGGYCHGAGGTSGGNTIISFSDAMGLNQFQEIVQFRTFNSDAWYQTLSAGIRPSPVGATDMPVGNGLIGSDRTYAYVEGELTMEKWLQAIAEGRCFATSGPLLEMTVDDNPVWEDTLLPAGGGTVTVVGWAGSRDAPETLELIKNGEVIETVTFDGQRRIEFSFDVPIEQTCWLAVRVQGELATGHRQVAHSNAAFVVVDHQPIAVDQGWRGPAWNANKLAGVRRLLNEEVEMNDRDATMGYYNPMLDAAREYFGRLDRHSKGRSIPLTLLMVYPTERLMPLPAGAPIPLPLAVAGVHMGPGCAGLRVQVDQAEPFIWRQTRGPIWLEPLAPGEHTVTLQLVDHEDTPLDNPEAMATKTLIVE